MSKSDISREQFLALWANGYDEDFAGYAPGTIDQLSAALDKYSRPGVVLDIGCGGGRLTTRLLSPRFTRVVALDLWPDRPKGLAANVTYHAVGSQDYSCSPVADATIDTVWSFGCFCHLSNSAVGAYMRSIRRVLKPDGVAVVMLANWRRAPHLRDISNPQRFRETPYDFWYYNDVETSTDLARRAGLTFKDAIPDFRDTLAVLRPCH